MKISMESILPSLRWALYPRTHPGAVSLIIEGLQIDQE